MEKERCDQGTIVAQVLRVYCLYGGGGRWGGGFEGETRREHHARRNDSCKHRKMGNR